MRLVYVHSISNRAHQVKSNLKARGRNHRARRLERAVITLAKAKAFEEVQRAQAIAAEFGNTLTPKQIQRIKAKYEGFVISEIAPADVWGYIERENRTLERSIQRPRGRVERSMHVHRCRRGHRAHRCAHSEDADDSSEPDSDTDTESDSQIKAIKRAILKGLSPRLYVP